MSLAVVVVVVRLLLESKFHEIPHLNVQQRIEVVSAQRVVVRQWETWIVMLSPPWVTWTVRNYQHQTRIVVVSPPWETWILF